MLIMNPALVMNLMTLGLAAAAILFTNERLDNTSARGEPTFEWFAVGALAVVAGLVTFAYQVSKQSWVGYVLALLTGAVIVLAYVAGTARFD
jgi:uncharacterized membrane protein